MTRLTAPAPAPAPAAAPAPASADKTLLICEILTF